jgi:hypothetical protein
MRMAGIITALLLAALTLTACGSVDNAKDKVGKSARGELSKQCLKRAVKLDNLEDRRSAIKACRAVGRGDSNTVREEFARRCLKRAVKISQPDLRRKAKSRCNKILAGGK